MMRRALTEGSPYLTDESKMTGYADVLWLPDDESDVKDVLREVSESGRTVTVSSMRTGVCGGAVPFGGDVLTVERMDRILGVGQDEQGFYIRVQPAVTVNQLNDLLRRRNYSTLEELSKGARESARSTDLFYPVDPTELNSSICGNVSTNASGPRTFKYGSTRDWVRRVRVVLVNGDVLDLKRGDIRAEGDTITFDNGMVVHVPTYDFRIGVKNATGIMSSPDLDAVDLFVGSEGIFGVITEIDVYLAPWHPLMSNIMFFPDDDSAYGFVRDLVSSEVMPEFLEFLDGGSLDLIRASRARDPGAIGLPELPNGAGSAVMFDLPHDGGLIDRYREIGRIAEAYGGSLDRSWCGHEVNDRKRLFALRHSVPQAIFDYIASLKGCNPGMHKMGTDMAVPLRNLDLMMSSYKEVLNTYELEYVMFGHIGNGHLHVEIMLKDMGDLERAKVAYRELAVKAIELGGSPSAEHGIGKIKTDYISMMYGEKGLDEIKKIKDVLDQDWILNRGNMVVR